MKLVSALLLAATIQSNGASTNGSPVGSTEILWSAPTNDWPRSMWIYKTIPQDFPPAMVSNLLTMAGFSEKDQTKAPPFFRDTDKKTKFFGNLEGAEKHLAICPTVGYIEYDNIKVEASSHLQKVESVPNQSETTKLGLHYLRQLGIDASLIARKPDSCGLDLHWEKGTIGYVDQTTQTEIILTNNFDVMFNRQVDGFKVRGFSGMDIRLGNKGQISKLQIWWPTLQPSELVPIPSPEAILQRIKTGQIPLPPILAKSKRLTITKAVPQYDGKAEDQPMPFLKPFIRLEATNETETITNSVWFLCPLL